MTHSTPPPFSRRFGFAKAGLIYEDFPEPARVGLYHLLTRLLAKGYIEDDWPGLDAELARLGRVPAGEASQLNTEAVILRLPWDKAYVLIERIYAVCLQGATVTRDGEQFAISLSHVQQYYEGEINQLFGEEGIGYELSGGLIVRPGRPHTQKAMARAAHVLAVPELKRAATHYAKAAKFFSAAPHADLENACKEAVAAVEAAATALFPEQKANNLDDLLKRLQGTDERSIPPTLVKAILALYAFRGAAEGVSHGSSSGGVVTSQVAEWVLSQAAAHITYLADFAAALADDVPF